MPGHYGTYWVKHLNEIIVIDNIYEGFWMKAAYRIPDNSCACIEPGQVPAVTVPIKRFDVRSFITNLADGSKVDAKTDVLVKGIAFDSGNGITDVLLSTDAGQTWNAAKLGPDLGRYSFRQWQTVVQLPPGKHELKVRAINRIGQSQPMAPLWNPPGYMRNVVETVRVQAG